VVVDGRTGKYLEATVGFFPAGLPTVVTTPEPVPTPCPVAPPNAVTPWSVAVGALGNVFVGGPGISGYREYSAVQKRSAGGRLLFSFSTQAPHGNCHQIIRIALDTRGDVYVANDDNVIQKFGPDGHRRWQWFPHGHRPPETNGWWNIAVAPDGTAYTASMYRAPIYVLSPRGHVLGTRPGRWSTLAVAPNRILWAANAGHGLVQAFSPAGQLLRSWHMGHSGGIAGIISMTTGGDGSVYVLDQRVQVAKPYYEVMRFSSTDLVLRRIRIPQGPAAGQLMDPRDLAVGANGAIYLADTGNPRIVMYSDAGRYLESWTL
jgi:tripartite motif-containing protein 71